jgi:transcriptional regulator with XRE-family HTH domain
MKGSIIDELKNNSEEMRLYQQEWLILEVTELVASLMKDKRVSKTELAKRLGRSKGYITQLLDGRANMTLRTVADLMWALDASLGVSAHPLGFETGIEMVGQYELAEQADSWVVNFALAGRCTDGRGKVPMYPRSAA